MAKHYPTVMERIFSRFEIHQNGCWIWTGTLNNMGYAEIKVNRRNKFAHRVLYEAEIGPIPEGLELDHLCRTPSCINPSHLEPVTHAENMRRGTIASKARDRQKSKTHCPNGHEYTDANTLVYHTDWRQCKQCRHDQYMARKAKI